MDSKFIGKCYDLNDLGQGLVNYDNNIIVVDGLLIDEEAEIIITKKTHKYYLGRIHKLIKTSDNRNHYPCSHKCGGCDLIHMSYPSQIDYKNLLIKEMFKDYNVSSIIPAESNNYYRNKVIYALDYKNNSVYFGLYEENTHTVINTASCLVNNKLSKNIIINILNPSYAYYYYTNKINEIDIKNYKLSNLLGDKYNENENEIQNMMRCGWLQVYDCGTIKVEYNKEV